MTATMEKTVTNEQGKDEQNGVVAAPASTGTEWFDLTVGIDELPKDTSLEGERPVGDLVDQIIAREGLIERIVFRQLPDSEAETNFADASSLIAGRRRIQAIRAAIKRLDDEADTLEKKGESGSIDQINALRALAAKLSDVPVRVMVTGDDADALVTKIVSHSTRRDNLAVELGAMEALLALDYKEDRIAKESGTNVAHVRKVLSLSRLIPELRDALEKGQITGWVGYRASSLSEEKQREAYAILQQKGKLVTTDVAALKNRTRKSAVENLGGDVLVGDDLEPDDSGEAPVSASSNEVEALRKENARLKEENNRLVEQSNAALEEKDLQVKQLENAVARLRKERLPHPELAKK